MIDRRPDSAERNPRTVLDAIVARFEESFGDGFEKDVPLSRFTTSRLGGKADFLITVRSIDELVEAVTLASRQHIAFWVLGAGSNVLVSDTGIRGLVIRNRAQETRFRHNGQGVVLRAGSGANISRLARQCSSRGLTGLEWAAGIPGTVGGAVVGNAGAHGGSMADSLRLATLLDTDLTMRDYLPEEMEFGYRSSTLKKSPVGQGESDRVVIAAEFQLEPFPVEEVQERMAEIVSHRKQTQPPGASMGCMFKNPPDDHAGRLIDQAGLKGTRMGGARISPVHANFFVNDGDATAEDVRRLMSYAWHEVKDRFEIELEPEVELIGDWE